MLLLRKAQRLDNCFILKEYKIDKKEALHNLPWFYQWFVELDRSHNGDTFFFLFLIKQNVIKSEKPTQVHNKYTWEIHSLKEKKKQENHENQAWKELQTQLSRYKKVWKEKNLSFTNVLLWSVKIFIISFPPKHHKRQEDTILPTTTFWVLPLVSTNKQTYQLLI